MDSSGFLYIFAPEFSATADAALEAEFVAIKTSWNFKDVTWEREKGYDASKNVTINGMQCDYANGDLSGLALQGCSSTNWTVNSSGLTQGNSERNIGILNCTAGQMVTVQTSTALSNPVNGTRIGTGTTGTVHYKVTANGTFGFQTSKFIPGTSTNGYFTSITVTDMDYRILYAGDKEAYDTKATLLMPPFRMAKLPVCRKALTDFLELSVCGAIKETKVFPVQPFLPMERR